VPPRSIVTPADSAVLAEHPDGEVGVAIPVNVARRKGSTEIVARLGPAWDGRAVLVDGLGVGRDQPGRPAADGDQRAGGLRLWAGPLVGVDHYVGEDAAVELADQDA
jgi:hypothetical protein